MLFQKEHYEIMAQFEKTFENKPLDKEPKYLWVKGSIYQNGCTNDLFSAYMLGYSLGRVA